MNAILNKLFLAAARFIPEMPVRQPKFTFGACGQFSKKRNRYKKQV